MHMTIRHHRVPSEQVEEVTRRVDTDWIEKMRRQPGFVSAYAVRLDEERLTFVTAVLDAAGNRVGTAESLLGDENADIFHGLAVKLSHGGRLVEIPAAQVTRITLSGVQTAIEPAQVADLEPYSEDRWFHLGWGGLF